MKKLSKRAKIIITCIAQLIGLWFFIALIAIFIAIVGGA